MRLAIDPRCPTPPSEQLADQVRFAVAAGRLRPGERLPSVRAIAGEVRVNPNTVSQGLARARARRRDRGSAGRGHVRDSARRQRGSEDVRPYRRGARAPGPSARPWHRGSRLGCYSIGSTTRSPGQPVHVRHHDRRSRNPRRRTTLWPNTSPAGLRFDRSGGQRHGPWSAATVRARHRSCEP